MNRKKKMAYNKSIIYGNWYVKKPKKKTAIPLKQQQQTNHIDKMMKSLRNPDGKGFAYHQPKPVNRDAMIPEKNPAVVCLTCIKRKQKKRPNLGC